MIDPALTLPSAVNVAQCTDPVVLRVLAEFHATRGGARRASHPFHVAARACWDALHAQITADAAKLETFRAACAASSIWDDSDLPERIRALVVPRRHGEPGE